MRSTRWLSVLIFPLIALLAACNFSLAADVTPPPGYVPPPEIPASPSPLAVVFPLVPPDVTQGAAIYAEKCAPCHGPEGLGDGPQALSLPNPVTALGDPQVARAATPARWFKVVSEGNLERFMPPFRSLSERQRWDVVAYAFSLSVTPAEIEEGASLFIAHCASCHGESGRGDGPLAAALTVPDLTDQERMAGKSANDLFQVISNGVGQMPAFAEQLNEGQIWALTAYLRSLTFVSASEEAAPERPTPTQSSDSSSAATPVAEAAPQATNLGAVSGVVTTADGSPAPAGLEVHLHAFDQRQLVFTATTTTAEGGVYRFDDLEMPAGRAFLTTVEFEGVVYGSQVVQAEQEATQLDLPLRVYPSSTDTSLLVVDRLHYFFEFVDERTLRVLELYIISNPSGKTVVATQAGEAVLTFSLPAGAQNLQFDEGALGERFIPLEGGFGDTFPVRPGIGEHQVLFSYELPYERKLELERPIPLFTQAVIILVPQDGIRIKGAGLEDAGTRQIQGTTYHLYNGTAMPAGSVLQLTISGSPSRSTAFWTRGPSTNLLIGALSLGMALLLAGAWLYRRNRLAAPLPVGGTVEREQLSSAEAVMDAILALDDLYQEGKLPEEAYRQRRAALKQQLKDLLEKPES